MNDEGVPLAVGTENALPGMTHGASFHKELEVFADAGIPPMDILVAATLNSARVAGKESEIGTVEVGKLADMVILDADPLVDIANAGKISKVMKSGILFEHEELLA